MEKYGIKKFLKNLFEVSLFVALLWGVYYIFDNYDIEFVKQGSKVDKIEQVENKNIENNKKIITKDEKLKIIYENNKIKHENLWEDSLGQESRKIDEETVEVKDEILEVLDLWETEKIEKQPKKLEWLCRKPEDDTEMLEQIKKFPKAVDISYNLELPVWECPRVKNYSKIYFNTSYNSWNDRTKNWEYKLSWLIINDVEKIEVIWDGDMESYFLNKYVPWESKFTYNISTKWNNIKEGENKYLIRWYSKNGIYERIFNLNYYNFDNITKLESIKKIYNEDEATYDINIWYKKDWNTYSLWLTYWTSILDLWDKKILIYNDFEDNLSYVEIQESWIIKKINYSLFTYEFSSPAITYYDNWDLLFEMSWHESPINYLYYSSSNKKTIKIFDIIWANVEKNENWRINYYSETKQTDWKIIINSINNPWVQWEYTIELDLDTLEVIKK